MFPRPVKAVVFDMDGLLFDTEVVYRAAMQAAARDHGVEVSDAFYASLVGLPPETGHPRILAQFGQDFPVAEFQRTSHARFRALLDGELRLKPGVTELLDWLDARGLPRAIATSSARVHAEHHLTRFDLAERFHALVAHGDYPAGKPDPAPYLVAAERLGVAPADCLALEDSHNGVRSGAAAGMMTVMVPDLLPPTEPIRALALAIARDLHEVRTWLEQA